MKIKKVVKYNYELTEETLEDDIGKFIEHAKRGGFHMDKMYENEGLKIIKQYLKILNEKFKNNELEECKKCYHKLIPFLLISSSAEGDLFDYNDMLAMLRKDFDDYIRNYFICLVKTCDINELADKVSKYASSLDVYGFDSDKEILLNNLNKEQLNELQEKMLLKTIGMTKKDEDKRGIVYFLMSIAEVQEDREKYLRLCQRFKGILIDKEFEYLKNEYEENKAIGENLDKILNQTKKEASR